MRISAFSKPLHALHRDKKGVTALEFALVSPVLLLLLMGTMEFSLAMYANNLMESATAQSSRLGRTGYVASGISREQTILNEMDGMAGHVINMANVTVTAISYSNWDEIGQEEPYQDTNGNDAWDSGEDYDDINGNGEWDTDMGTAGYGDADDVVVYEVSYPWSIQTPIFNQFLGSGGVLVLSTRAVVKNEPYDL